MDVTLGARMWEGAEGGGLEEGVFVGWVVREQVWGFGMR